MKGFGSITVILTAVVVLFLFLFLTGVATNYGKHNLDFDLIGIGTFFLAVQDTVSGFSILTNTIVWTMMFFLVEGIFIYAYYKLARFIWVNVPQIQKWMSQTKQWMSK